MDLTSLVDFYNELKQVRDESQWERKLTAASYLHHRDGYKGTLVETRETNDSSAVSFLETYVRGMLGNLLPREQNWAKFLPAGIIRTGGKNSRPEIYTRYKHLDSNRELYENLETLTDLVFVALEQSNFYESMNMYMTDAAVFGTGFMLVIDEWGHKRKLRGNQTFKLRFQVVDPQECVISEDEHLQPDTYVRHFYMSPLQIFKRWGVRLNGNAEGVLSFAGTSSDQVEVYEALVRRDFVDDEDGEETDRPFVYVVYIPQYDKDSPVEKKRVRDFCLFPLAVGRDSDKSPYGKGIGTKSLDTMVVLDEYAESALAMGQRAGKPPLLVPYTMKDNFQARPGTYTPYLDENQRAYRIFEGENPSVLLTMIQDQRESLKRLWYADLFTAIMQSNDSRRTAYEISETLKQVQDLLKDHIYSLENVISRILIHVAHIVLEQVQYIGGVTEENERMLRNVLPNCRVAFNSTFMNMMQSYMNTQGLTSVLNLIISLLQAGLKIDQNFDINGIVRQIAAGNGVDTTLMVSLEKVLKEQKAEKDRNNRAVDAEISKNEANANEMNARASNMQNSGGTQIAV